MNLAKFYFKKQKCLKWERCKKKITQPPTPYPLGIFSDEKSLERRDCFPGLVFLKKAKFKKENLWSYLFRRKAISIRNSLLIFWKIENIQGKIFLKRTVLLIENFLFLFIYVFSSLFSFQKKLFCRKKKISYPESFSSLVSEAVFSRLKSEEKTTFNFLRSIFKKK